jgi:choice-of-anchor B domain-containing protein
MTMPYRHQSRTNGLIRLLLAMTVGLAHGALALPRDFQAPADSGRTQGFQALSDQPCVEGMAGDFHCQAIDLLAFVPLSEMGCTGNGNDLWGWTDPVTGTDYALMGCANGTAFVDLSQPTQPLPIGFLPTQTDNSLWRDIKVHADHAYIVSEASGHGLQVFDLGQLRDVVNPPVQFTPSAHLASFGNAHNLAINQDSGFAYALGSNVCSGGLHFIDISNPAQPAAAGCFSSDGYTHDTQCVIYQGPSPAFQGRELCFNANINTLTIVDVTDKGSPIQLSRTSYLGAEYAHQGWLTEDHRHFLLGDELDELELGHNTRTRIWDVSDPVNPVIIGVHDADTDAIDHNLYIRGRFVYQSNYTAGLRILDLAEVGQGQLTEVAHFDVIPHQHGVRHEGEPGFTGTWSNYPWFDNGLVIVSTLGLDGEPGGLFVLRAELDEPLFADRFENQP